MTPIEFQSYSGSSNSDWKDVIKIYNYELNQMSHLKKNRMNRTSKLLSIKNLQKNGIFIIHSHTCECNNGLLNNQVSYLKIKTRILLLYEEKVPTF